MSWLSTRTLFKLWLQRRWKTGWAFGWGQIILGGKIGEREIGCGALKNSTETSSADNESKPEQLFVLAHFALKLGHLLLTEVAQCASPNASVYNIMKLCPLLLHSALLSIIGGKSEFFCWERLSSIISCRWVEGEQLNEWVFSLELLSWGCTSLHEEVVVRALSLNKYDN